MGADPGNELLVSKLSEEEKKKHLEEKLNESVNFLKKIDRKKHLKMSMIASGDSSVIKTNKNERILDELLLEDRLN